MVFSESVKLTTKQKAHYRCCMCEDFGFLDVHHIIPQNAGGDDSINNAAALCKKCHDLYDGNDEKRKFIRERRDFWYDYCEKRLSKENLTNLDQLYELMERAREKHKPPFKLPIEGPSMNGLKIAEKYWRFATKSKSTFFIVFLVPAILSIFLVQDYWLTKIMNNLTMSLSALLVPLLQFYSIFLKITSTCPKCNTGFAISEVDRELIDHKTLGQERIENLKVTDGCRFCDYKTPRLLIKTIQL